MSKIRATILAVGVFIASLLHSQEIKATKFGKGILDIKGKDSSWSMHFAARIQLLSQASSPYTSGNLETPTTSFSVRRARLKFDGFAYNPKLKYKIELGLSNNDIGGASSYTNNAPLYIFDAVVMWNFHENFELWAGQTKLPGNRERVISSGDMQLVDRSILNSHFNIDRDMGFQLRHKTNLGGNFFSKEIFALSQGEGRNITRGNLGGLQYTGRIELLPFGEFKSKGDYVGGDLVRETTPKLSVAATYDFNNKAVKTRSNLGSYMTTDKGIYSTDITTIFVDGMFKYQGFSTMFEYANRMAEDAIAKNEDGTTTGAKVEIGNSFNVQSGYLFKNNWEISGRYTYAKFDDIVGKPLEEQYTLGLSKYIVGHKLKVQSDLTYNTIDGEGKGFIYRLQMDLHF